jgi:DNA-directed RNA polymerase specialized sigma24 family protein
VRSARDNDLDDLADVAVAAQQGDRAALSTLSRELQQSTYRLALRFCGHPLDAEDVTLEVMLRLLTSLETYDGRSRVTIWVYRNAVRQLLRTEPRSAEAAARGGASTPFPLLCLSREDRVAYVLTDLLGFTVAEGANICAVDDETFQDHLILARSTMRQRRGVSSGPAVADTDGSDAPDSVWSRLVATMPSHLGSS